MWPKGKEKKKKHYPEILELKHQQTEWQNDNQGNRGHDKPDHPFLTDTAHHIQQNTEKNMSKQDKGPRSRH